MCDELPRSLCTQSQLRKAWPDLADVLEIGGGQRHGEAQDGHWGGDEQGLEHEHEHEHAEERGDREASEQEDGDGSFPRGRDGTSLRGAESTSSKQRRQQRIQSIFNDLEQHESLRKKAHKRHQTQRTS